MAAVSEGLALGKRLGLVRKEAELEGRLRVLGGAAGGASGVVWGCSIKQRAGSVHRHGCCLPDYASSLRCPRTPCC